MSTGSALLALLCAGALAGADVRSRLLGTWTLVSYEITDKSGKTEAPFGPNPAGAISYDAQGRMSAQLMRPGVARFASESTLAAKAAEAEAAWRGYIAYFGRYTVDEKARAVTHHVEGAWFPNYIGTKQVRYYRFEGDRLILEADTAVGRARVVWRR